MGNAPSHSSEDEAAASRGEGWGPHQDWAADSGTTPGQGPAAPALPPAAALLEPARLRKAAAICGPRRLRVSGVQAPRRAVALAGRAPGPRRRVRHPGAVRGYWRLVAPASRASGSRRSGLTSDCGAGAGRSALGGMKEVGSGFREAGQEPVGLAASEYRSLSMPGPTVGASSLFTPGTDCQSLTLELWKASAGPFWLRSTG